MCHSIEAWNRRVRKLKALAKEQNEVLRIELVCEELNNGKKN